MLLDCLSSKRNDRSERSERNDKGDKSERTDKGDKSEKSRNWATTKNHQTKNNTT